MLRSKLVILPSLVHRISTYESTIGYSLLHHAYSTISNESSSSNHENKMPSPSPQPSFTYDAPFSTAVKRVKKLSLFSCGCALAACPIILGLDAQNTVTAKLSIAATLASFGVLTTGLLHWFTSPYVHKLTYYPKENAADVVTLDLLGRPRPHRIYLHEVHEADSVHPLSTFAVNNKKMYYIDADNFSDKVLLSKLAPQATAAHLQAVTEQAIVNSNSGGGNVGGGSKKKKKGKK